MVWYPWLGAGCWCLNFLNTSHLPKGDPLEVAAFPISLSAWSLPSTPASRVKILLSSLTVLSDKSRTISPQDKSLKMKV